MYHPATDKNFKGADSDEVWYMGHPLAPDEHFTFQQNMDHVVHMMRLFFDCGIRVIAPYHTICLALPDDNDEWRKIGLECDCYVAKKLGRLILCGHKVSAGMKCELDAVVDFEYGQAFHSAYNFVGWKDDQIREFFRELAAIPANG